MQRRGKVEKRGIFHMRHSRISRLTIENIVRVFERLARHNMDICAFLVASCTSDDLLRFSKKEESHQDLDLIFWYSLH